MLKSTQLILGELLGVGLWHLCLHSWHQRQNEPSGFRGKSQGTAYQWSTITGIILIAMSFN
jgi:hypothetical protein